MTTLYMHTLNSQPAEFVPKSGVIYTGVRDIKRFAVSLRQIRKEQAISKRKDLLDKVGPFTYGYVRLQLNGTAL